jgi:phosphatidylglycerophosphate synthase
MSSYEQSKKPDEFFLITRYFSRRFAYPLALMFQRLGFTANQVTLLGGAAWIASIISILLAGWAFQHYLGRAGWMLIVMTALLWNTGYILDVADGSLARMNKSASLSGFYLDYYFHLLFQPMFLASIGIFFYIHDDLLIDTILALLSIGCNWGVSFSAKEHVLCEAVAKGTLRPDRMPEALRYRFFIDSVKTKQAADTKSSPWAKARFITEEMFCFPGQFMLLGATVLADMLLAPWTDVFFPCLRIAFRLICVVMIARIPFRLRREFQTLRELDKMLGNNGAPQP